MQSISSSEEQLSGASQTQPVRFRSHTEGYRRRTHKHGEHRKSRERTSLFHHYRDGSWHEEDRRVSAEGSTYRDPNTGSQRVLSCLEMNVPEFPHMRNVHPDKKQKRRNLQLSGSVDQGLSTSHRKEPYRIPYITPSDTPGVRRSQLFGAARRSKGFRGKYDSKSTPDIMGGVPTLDSNADLNHSFCRSCGNKLNNSFYHPAYNDGLTDSHFNLTPRSMDSLNHPRQKQRAERGWMRDPSNWSDEEEMNGNVVDKMEIHYVADENGQPSAYLSGDAQRLIVQLAKNVSKKVHRLDEMAELLKTHLDDQLGPIWHVVIGVDSYGSHLESLPGAMVHFKTNNHVFLIWQT